MVASSLSGSMHNPRMLQVLQEVWGYTTFREPQEAVILNALAGNDGLVVMATGGGKSLCYQVPPLVSGRPCVVISPLIALMEDQVAALNARGVKAAFLGSAQTSSEVKHKAWHGEYQLVYITPELASNQTSQLQQLHSSKRIGLIAVDEAHCVSEWGHDFRPDYRQLGCLRQALPGVPIIAVTATATQRVRQDILNNLGMGKPGGPHLQQWVMSFQRTNLHLSVQIKTGSTAANNLAMLVAEAREAQAKGLKVDSTLIYAQTVREVDDITAHLQAKDVPVVKYHAKMPLKDRMSAHRAFQRDDAPVMVATVAFGMGIDKPNIRRIVHFGIPSSLESYYQQVGRAGRDGLSSKCCLMWSSQDFNTMDFIKGAQGLSGWNLESHSRGMAALRTYTNSGDCRHALLVNFFQPDTMQNDGPCTGGCDNCQRRAEAAAAAASGGARSASGAPAGQTDVTEPTRLLLATVKGLRNCFGTARAVSVLRGSKAKNVESWMMELRDTAGNVLHGAGNSRSDDWWKGLAGVLMGQGHLQSQHKSNASGAAWSVTQVTTKGHQFLNNSSAQLHVMLPVHMEVEENRKQQKEAAERQRAAAREAEQQQFGEVELEKEQLLAALQQTRKQIADRLNQAPDTLVNDATLNQMKELRPTTDDELMLVGGFGAKALMHFAVPLLQVVKDFCVSSKHLKPTTDWHFVRRSKDAANQRGLQQASGQFAHWNQQQQGHGTEQGSFSEPNRFSQSGLANAEQTQNTCGLASSRSAQGLSQHHAAGAGFGVCAEAPMLVTDLLVYQSQLDSKVLNEPRGAAHATWERFIAGEAAEQIANLRDKPIQLSTVMGYLAEAAAAAGAAGGCPRHLLQRLQTEAGLAGSAAADTLLWKVLPVISREQGLTATKKALPDDVSYGQIKVAAALLSLQALPQLDTISCQLESPTIQVARSAAVDKLLPLPGAAAQQLYARWRAGVPLAVLGTLDGMNLQLQAVLSALAEMAAAGYPADMQQLADAALLQEPAALEVSAAIEATGQAGIHAVKQQLDPCVGYGQIKVVAALMAVKGLWFSPAAVAVRELEELEGLEGLEADLEATDHQGHQQPYQQQQQQQGVQLVDAPQSSGPGQPSGIGPGCQGAALLANEAGKATATEAEHQATKPPVLSASTADGIILPSPAAQSGANDDDLCVNDQPAIVASSAAAAGKRRAGFLLGNKSGKRRRPTAIAPPPAAAVAQPSSGTSAAAVTVPTCTPAPSGPAGLIVSTPAAAVPRQQQQQHTPGDNFVTPVMGAAANHSRLQTVITPLQGTIVSQEAVLRLLWSGGCTAVQLREKLGITGSQQEQQLQQVLQALIEAGDQVCTTPANGKVDVNDDCVRFIAF